MKFEKSGNIASIQIGLTPKRADSMTQCVGFKTLKGSNVYRNDIGCFHTTPSGSHPSHVKFFYKNQIPSGLFLENIESEIGKGLAELKGLTGF